MRAGDEGPQAGYPLRAGLALWHGGCPEIFLGKVRQEKGNLPQEKMAARESVVTWSRHDGATPVLGMAGGCGWCCLGSPCLHLNGPVGSQLEPQYPQVCWLPSPLP